MCGAIEQKRLSTTLPPIPRFNVVEVAAGILEMTTLNLGHGDSNAALRMWTTRLRAAWWSWLCPWLFTSYFLQCTIRDTVVMGINNIPTKSISTLKQGCGEKHDACNVHMNALPSYCGRDGCTCQSCKTNMKPPKWSDIFVCLRSLRVGVASNKTDVQTNTCIKYLLWVSPQTIFDFVRCETTSPRTRSTCEWDRFRSSLNVLAALCAPKTQQDRRPSLIHPTEWNHYMPFDQKKWCISKWINMSAMGWLATKTVVYWFETNGLREAMVHNPFDGNVWQFPPTENHTRWWFDQARLYVRWNERGMVTPVWRTWCFWFVMSTLLTCSFIGDVATHISCPRCYKIMK